MAGLRVLAFCVLGACLVSSAAVKNTWLDAAKSFLPASPWEDHNGWYSWSHVCRLRRNPVEHLKATVAATFVGQTEALNVILNALQAWDDDIKAGTPHPLILALKGPTGVGKTRLAHSLAAAVLGDTTSSIGSIPTPKGLIEINGKDFTTPSDVTGLLRSVLVRELGYCNGHGVVVFDEAQLADPRAINEIGPLLERDSAALYDGDTRIDCSRVVFILISDIGTNALTKLFVEVGDINVSNLHWISKLMTRKMEEVWANTDVGGKFTAVVPFMPYLVADMPALIDKVIGVTTAKLTASGMFGSIVVTPAALEKLAQVPFVEYVAVSKKSGEVVTYSRYGARPLYESETGPARRLRAALWKLADSGGKRKKQPGVMCAIKNCDIEYEYDTGKFDVVVDATTDATTFKFTLCKRGHAQPGDAHCNTPQLVSI